MTGDQERACADALDVIVVARRGEHRMLLAVADLVARNVAGASGYRTTRRLVEDLWRVNPSRARRLVTRAALLLPSTSMTGEVLPAALPATAVVHEQGLVEDEHLRVIASTMEHLARIPGLDPRSTPTPRPPSPTTPPSSPRAGWRRSPCG